MCRRLIPDCTFPDYAAVTPAWLTSRGIRVLVLDIDNTLAPYEVAEPDEPLCAWFAALAAAGITAVLVSNNHEERVARFAAPLGVRYYPDAHKPLRGTLRRALADVSAAEGETALLGDQIFTDVWSARRIGALALTVPPIRDKRDPFTRFKRLLERPLMRAYARREKRAAEVPDNCIEKEEN